VLATQDGGAVEPCLLWIVCVIELTTARRGARPLKGASYRIDQHFKTLFNLPGSCRDIAFDG